MIRPNGENGLRSKGASDIHGKRPVRISVHPSTPRSLNSLWIFPQLHLSISVFPLSLWHFPLIFLFFLLRLPFKVHHLCSVLFCSWISPVQSEIFWRDPEGDILCLGDHTTFCQVDIYVSVYDLENLRCQVGGAVYWCVDGGQKWYQLIGKFLGSEWAAIWGKRVDCVGDLSGSLKY